MRPPLLIALLSVFGLAVFLMLPPGGHEEAPAPSAAPPPAPSAAPPPVPSDRTPVSPESLAAEVEAIRGLRFTTPLQFPRISAAELEKRVRTAMTAAIPPAEAALRMRAALALGLIRPCMEFDAADCLTGSAMEVPAGFYDSAAAVLWVNDAFSPETRPDLTVRLVFHLARALLLQQPGRALPPLPSMDDDAILTAIAVVDADATITARRHTRQYAARFSGGVAVPEVFTYHASPPFLRAALAFPGGVADSFHATLRENSPGSAANDFLNGIASRPPRTTAELLHPAAWPAPPAPAVVLNRMDLTPLSFLTENTLGEFGVRTLLKTQLTSTEAETAAAGLLSDRYLLLAGAGPGQDHLLWRTRWASAEDATAFLRALAAMQLGNAGITAGPEHFPEPDTFQAATPLRTLHAAARPDHTVTFAASPDSAIVRRLLDSP